MNNDPGHRPAVRAVAVDGKERKLAKALTGVLITADAMQTQRAHARWLAEDKDAHYLLPALGNQPGLFARLDALPWEEVPVAATVDVARGRIETRTRRADTHGGSREGGGRGGR